MKTATVIEDSDGQLLFQFDSDTLSQMGWDIGTNIEWNIEEDGTVTLTKANDQD